MSNYPNEQLLSLWLDGRLNLHQRVVFEQRCIEDEAFAEQVKTANTLRFHTENYSELDVPSWNRGESFIGNVKPRWWHWQGLSGLSITLSLVVMVMVVSGFQIKLDNGVMTMSFATKQTSQDIELLLNKKLQEFQADQQIALSRFTQSLQQQQIDTSTQLTQYLLTSSRKERREDFAELIKFINEQRSDDQLFYARQLNQLEQEIYTNPTPTNLNSNK